MTEIVISNLNKLCIKEITKYHNKKFDKELTESEMADMLLWEVIKYYVINDYIRL